VSRASLLLALLLVAGLPPGAARAYATRHVVIVVVDGARFSETFGDPAFAHTPRQGLDLAPLGCRGTGWNAGVTSTVPGHAAILSGAYQALANDGIERPHLPLIFEYYRAATGAPRSQAWFFSAKPKLDVMSNSDDPAYGDSLGACVDVSCPTDSAVVARAEAVLLSGHPALVALNLPQTDQVAHGGDWPGYLAALQRADSLVYDLWLKVQSDTALAGRTTLFVTNDHGRHDDAHGGFTNHGDGCDGCRRLQLLALGPDFRTAFVQAALAQQVDIAPTVGELLGFPTPWATGRVMTDLLGEAGPVGVAPDAGGPRLRFGAPAPNPTRDSVRLPLEVPRAGHLRVVVLDAQGRGVATLADGEVAAGPHALTWSGRTSGGRRLQPGAYFVRARLGGLATATRVVLR
jgi:hypothetical protein